MTPFAWKAITSGLAASAREEGLGAPWTASQPSHPSVSNALFRGILLAELRSEEAFDYLRNVNSGHPGSITSVHAASAELAFEQLVLLVKQNQGGRELARRDIKNLLYLLIDVVIQFGVEHHERYIKEIWYEPQRKRRPPEREDAPR